MYMLVYIYIYYVYRHNIYIYIYTTYIYIYTLCIYIDMYIYIYAYGVQNPQYVRGFWLGFQGCSNLVKRALLLEMISGLVHTHFAASYSYNLCSARLFVLCSLAVLGLLALLALLGPSVGKWVCWGFPDLVRSLWDLVLVLFCLPPRIKENWAWKPPCSLQRRAWKQKRQKLKPLL